MIGRMTDKRYEDILQHAKRVSQELDSLSAYDRLIQSVDNHQRINPDDEIPKALILNKEMFTKWFYWCQENNWNYKDLHGVQIVLKKEAPFQVAALYSKVES